MHLHAGKHISASWAPWARCREERKAHVLVNIKYCQSKIIVLYIKVHIICCTVHMLHKIARHGPSVDLGWRESARDLQPLHLCRSALDCRSESPRRLPAAPVPEAVAALGHPDVHRPQDGSGIRGRRRLAARARTWEGEEAWWRGKVRGERSGRGRGKGAAEALGSDVAEQRGDHGLHRRASEWPCGWERIGSVTMGTQERQYQ